MPSPCNVDGPHPGCRGPEQNKKVEEGRIHSLPDFLSWDTCPLPSGWGLFHQLSWVSNSWTMDYRESQFSLSCEPIPYNKSIYISIYRERYIDIYLSLYTHILLVLCLGRTLTNPHSMTSCPNRLPQSLPFIFFTDLRNCFPHLLVEYSLADSLSPM